MDGVLVIDKPVGPTSHDVVAEIRTILRERKVGHTGTLDPAATGVLPLVIGRATKLARYLTGRDKAYRATIRLGVKTDTLDATGQTLAESAVLCSEADVRAAVTSFVGDVEQIPPMYSAKKMDGKKLYELARQGISVERTPKIVTLHNIEVVSVALPDVVIDVRCTAGTYVRVLAQDLGDALGCGGHLLQLRRTLAGPFDLSRALTLDAVREQPDAARAAVLSLTEALVGLPQISVPSDIARLIRSGHQLTVADLRTLDVPRFDHDDVLTIAHDSGAVVAVVSATLASAELDCSRRDQKAFKTERVL